MKVLISILFIGNVILMSCGPSLSDMITEKLTKYQENELKKRKKCTEPKICPIPKKGSL